MYEFLEKELTFASALSSLFDSVVEPLIDATSGYALETSISAAQTQSITLELQDKSVQKYLRACEGLASEVKVFAEKLRLSAPYKDGARAFK